MVFDRWSLSSSSTPRQWARTHHMKQRWSSFRGFQMAFFLARVSGSSFQQPPASLGGGGAGMSASCCEGAVSRYAAHDGPVGLGEAGALERHLELRPDGRHHGSGAGRRRRGPHDPRRQPEEVVHPVLVLVVRSRARQQDLEADLGEEGQPNCQKVLEPVHQQPHGIDGEDLLPRKRAQPPKRPRALLQRRRGLRSLQPARPAAAQRSSC